MCESDRRMSRIIKLTLRGSAGEKCEQEMGESERTTVAFSLCKFTQTVRLSSSKGDCHFLVFLMNTTQERKKRGRNGRLKTVPKIRTAISDQLRTVHNVFKGLSFVIFTKLCLKKAKLILFILVYQPK